MYVIQLSHSLPLMKHFARPSYVICLPTVDWVLGAELPPRSSIVDCAEPEFDQECAFPSSSPLYVLLVPFSHRLCLRRECPCLGRC